SVYVCLAPKWLQISRTLRFKLIGLITTKKLRLPSILWLSRHHHDDAQRHGNHPFFLTKSFQQRGRASQRRYYRHELRQGPDYTFPREALPWLCPSPYHATNRQQPTITHSNY